MFRLVILNPPPGSPAHVPLEGLRVRLGRDPDNELVLDSPAVSRKHAILQQEAGAWWVEDLGGGNGTRLNDQRVQKAWLKPGDRLRVGKVDLVFELQPSALPPPLPAALPPPLPPSLPPPLPRPLPTPKPRSRVGLWTALAAGFLLLLGGAWVLREHLRSRPGTDTFLAFRERAGRDPRAAFAEAKAPAKLAELNANLWPTVTPEAGWTYFFRTCVGTVGPRKGKHQAVLFYHPWSDTALVTRWADGQQLIDLEMLPGVALRETGSRGGTLGWTHHQAYAPPAVGMVTAQTLKAFQRSFATETTLLGALPWLDNGQRREAARVASSLQFAQIVKSLATFSGSPDQPARLAFIRMLALGEASLAEAPQTPADSARALRGLPAEAWSGFQPTAFVDTPDRVLVMAHHRGSPDLFLGAVFRRDGAGLRPERLDLLSFSACYGALP